MKKLLLIIMLISALKVSCQHDYYPYFDDHFDNSVYKFDTNNYIHYFEIQDSLYIYPDSLFVMDTISFRSFSDTTYYDTIPVIMMVCDIGKKKSTGYHKVCDSTVYYSGLWLNCWEEWTTKEYYNYEIKWKYGYRYEIHYSMTLEYKYLDENKNKLPDNIIVWDYIEKK